MYDGMLHGFLGLKIPTPPHPKKNKKNRESDIVKKAPQFEPQKKPSYFPSYWLFNRDFEIMVYEIIPI